ncbi:MAG: segregation/condensation protein A [Gammaproteobacteria bacterium]|nr:segregation/condensation protein A [Gammaproteobacteria bacterium]
MEICPHGAHLTHSDASDNSAPDTDDALASVPTEVLAPEEASGQQELPFALVHGKPLTVLPRDLYIPPEALEVFLETFEGPLDLLLYLIRRQNLDILEINVARITEQYMQYVELMDAVHFELAAEYLVMSAMLAEIKSRMLLPRQESGLDEELDPRASLIRRLQEYEQFKQAAEDIDSLPRLERDVFAASAEPPEIRLSRAHPQVDLRELLLAFSDVVRRATLHGSHHIQFEKLSTRERMAQVLARLQTPHFVPFVALFTVEEGRMGVVVTFLAIMELIKESLVEMVQSEPFGPIHVRPRGQDAIEVDN